MPPANILLVDDDPVYREFGLAEIEAAGHNVVAAANGAEGFERFREGRFDLVISDYEMPVMDGIGFLQHVRAAEEGRELLTPFLMITGRDDGKSVERAFENGATSFVQKPVNWASLIHHIGFMLRSDAQAVALNEARQRADALSRTKDAILMTLRHELRSPLHVIQGFSELLVSQLGNGTNEDAKQACGYIEDAVGDMTDKIDKLFLYASTLNGTLETRIDSVDPSGALEGAIGRLAKTHPQLRDRLEIATGEASAHRLVKTDERLLTIALAHILDNALKFGGDAGPVSISSGGDDDMASLTIRDRGPGIDPDRVDEFLEGFEQGDAGLTRTSTGIGLGLAIANRLVVALGGRLDIANHPEGGAEITFRLPLAEARSLEEPQRQAAGSR